MYQDLERMHETIFDAYRSLIEVVDGIDLNEEAANQPLPTKHVKI
jgi:hypothetical protein